MLNDEKYIDNKVILERFNNLSQKKIKTALIYNSEFISGELRFVRKPNHGEKIIVYPMFILSLAAAASFLIPFSVGER